MTNLELLQSVVRFKIGIVNSGFINPKVHCGNVTFLMPGNLLLSALNDFNWNISESAGSSNMKNLPEEH